MFEYILNFFTTSVEHKMWGLNAPTFWALGVNAFTAVEWWGLQKQNKRIWAERSGISVSVTLYTYTCPSFLAFIFYGIAIESISSILNGLVIGVMEIPIVLGLWKFKKWGTREKMQFYVFLTIVPVMAAFAFTSWYNEMFLIVSLGMIVAAASMPWELWKEEKTGDLEIRLLGAYLASTVFWWLYAFAIDEWVLEFLASFNLFFLSITTILWCWYYRKEKRARA